MSRRAWDAEDMFSRLSDGGFMKDAGDRPTRREGGAQKAAGGIEEAEGGPCTIGKRAACVDISWKVGEEHPIG